MRIETVRRIDFIMVVLLIATLLAAAACSGDKEGKDAPADSGEREKSDEKDVEHRSISVSPHLVLRGLDGSMVSMAELRGKLVVLNFWTTWSKDSRELIEIMNALYPRFSKQFQFCAVSMDRGGAAVVRAFVHEHRISGDVFVNGEDVARALGGIGTVPATIVVYEDGRIIRQLEGLYRKKQYEELFASALLYRIATQRNR